MSDMICERLSESREQRRRRGLRIAGLVPYGYCFDQVTKGLAVVTKEAEHVLQIFEKAVDGERPSAIAAWVNQNGWRTKARTSKRSGRTYGGGAWTPRQVLSRLSNPTYAGLLRDGDRFRRGIHAAIVSPKLFHAVQRIVASRRTGKSKARDRSKRWLLQSLMRCGLCGRLMSPSVIWRGVRGYRYYRCRSNAGGRPPCRRVNSPAGRLERAVLEEIGRFDEREQSHPAAPLLSQLRAVWQKLDWREKEGLVPGILSSVVFDPDPGVLTLTFDMDGIADWLQSLGEGSAADCS